MNPYLRTVQLSLLALLLAGAGLGGAWVLDMLPPADALRIFGRTAALVGLLALLSAGVIALLGVGRRDRA